MLHTTKSIRAQSNNFAARINFKTSQTNEKTNCSGLHICSFCNIDYR